MGMPITNYHVWGHVRAWQNPNIGSNAQYVGSPTSTTNIYLVTNNNITLEHKNRKYVFTTTLSKITPAKNILLYSMQTC